MLINFIVLRFLWNGGFSLFNMTVDKHSYIEYLLEMQLRIAQIVLSGLVYQCHCWPYLQFFSFKTRSHFIFNDCFNTCFDEFQTISKLEFSFESFVGPAPRQRAPLWKSQQFFKIFFNTITIISLLKLFQHFLNLLFSI